MIGPNELADLRGYPGCPACASTVLELCDEIDRLRTEIAWYRDEIDRD